MKRITLLVGFLFIQLAFGQAPIIVPNGGFESWIDANQPVGWYEFNLNLGFTALHTVTRSTDAYVGSYAAQVASVDATLAVLPGMLSLSPITFDLNTFSLQFLSAGVSTQNRKVLQVSGNFKYLPAGSDTMAILVTCTK